MLPLRIGRPIPITLHRGRAFKNYLITQLKFLNDILRLCPFLATLRSYKSIIAYHKLKLFSTAVSFTPTSSYLLKVQPGVKGKRDLLSNYPLQPCFFGPINSFSKFLPGNTAIDFGICIRQMTGMVLAHDVNKGIG